MRFLIIYTEYTMIERNLDESIAYAMDLMLVILVRLYDEFAEFDKEQKAIHKEIKIISSKVNGDYTPPNQRKSANERLVQAAIDKYWNLIKNGTPERDALAMACHAVENASGLGGYKSFESFRNVVSREVKKGGHSLVESSLTLPID